MTVAAAPRVHIILLNWNNSADTLECLESLVRIDYPNYQIVVCDNASADDSVHRLREWAAGKRLAPDIAEPLRHIMEPPRVEPLPMAEIDRETAERGGTEESRAARFLLVRNEVNYGFAGGNNVALRYVLAAHPAGEPAYACLLNNDTVVTREWLSRMMEAASDPKVGAVGAMLYEYYMPDLVESAGGGRVHRWQGMPRATTATRQQRGTPRALPRRMDFITGACMLMSADTLRRVGLIDERYFIYCEDVDLSLRIRRAGLRLVLVPGAEMWHKNGGVMKHRSARHDYYMVRNSLLLVHKLYPALLPAAMAFSLYRCVVPKLVRGDWQRLRAVRGAYKDFFAFVRGRESAAGVGESAPPRT
jgi:GT2 family glycosyltransferase